MNNFEQFIFGISLHYINKKYKRRRTRNTYIRDILLRRRYFGEMNLVRDLGMDPEYHFRYFRMTKPNFDKILSLVSPLLTHSNTHARPISPIERLAMTLRYIASGNSQASLGFSYRISPASVSIIVRETLSAIWGTMVQKYLPAPKKDDYKVVAHDFLQKWNFPNCIGSVDGKHCKIKSPCNSGTEFFNYKNFFSIVLLGIVDANYKCLVVDIGGMGSQSDSGIFSNSILGKKLYSDTLDLPDDKILPNTTSKMFHVFLGDDAFPLMKNLLRPYPRKSNCRAEKIFNYRLSRARRVVENAFGILAARFRIFHTSINADMDLVDLIIKATVVLHNFLIIENDLSEITTDSEDADGNIIEGSWRNITNGDNCFENIRRFGTNNRTKLAEIIRNTFKTYFMSTMGSVNWQERVVP